MAPHITLRDLGARGRTVVVAPHPGDEIFAVGGAMTGLDWDGYEVDVVAVTDGELSPSSDRITPDSLRRLRVAETKEAYLRLGISPHRFRIGLPEGQVATHAETLRDVLRVRLAGAAMLFAPLETDGDPDHDATGEVALDLGRSLGVPVWRYAIFAREHTDRVVQGPGRALRLPREICVRKLRAVDAYVSQFTALGPATEDGPVLTAQLRSYFVQPWEPLWPA